MAVKTKYTYDDRLLVVSDGKFANGFFDNTVIRPIGYNLQHNEVFYVFQVHGKDYAISEKYLDTCED